MSGVELIAAERQRQITKEDWTPGHDDSHENQELVFAAEAYLDFATGSSANVAIGKWPWAEDEDSFKPASANPVRNLVKAGALIAAEIDRLLRLGGSGGTPVLPIADCRHTLLVKRDEHQAVCDRCGVELVWSEACVNWVVKGGAT